MTPTRILLKLGTRGSPLALWQARHVAEALGQAHPGLEVELVKIRTLAEKFPEQEVPAIGTGIFTKEIDEALLQGKIDLAVHSLKDVPTEMHEELTIAAVPTRESPLDAFLSADGTALLDLPSGARLGTGSPRRKAQLLHRRPGLEVVPLRGNVGTRLRKVKELGLAGTILAHAGLKRLGEEGRITHLIGPEVLVPAVSQGAIGILARGADARVLALLAPLDHEASHLRVTAERGFLRALRGGCQVPAGALATLAGTGTLTLTGVIAAPDGSACVRGEVAGDPAAGVRLGEHLAADLLVRGGERILRDLGRAVP